MADASDLASLLFLSSGAKQSLAASDPYLQFGGMTDKLGTDILGSGDRFSTKEKIIGGLLTGLLSGVSSGFSNDYQSRASSAYQDTIKNIILGETPTKPDVLPSNLFKAAKEQASLFKTMQALQVGEELRKFNLDKQANINKALLGIGYVGTDANGNPIKIDALDPIQQKVEEKKALEGIGTEKWFEKMPTQMQTNISQVGALSTELNKLAAEFRAYDGNILEYQSSKKIGGTKANALMTQVMALVPAAARMMGEVGNLSSQEQQNQINITLGNITSGPNAIADRLERLSALGRNMAASKLQSFKTAEQSSSGSDALLASMQNNLITDNAAPLRASELIAKGYTKGPNGWIPPASMGGVPRG